MIKIIDNMVEFIYIKKLKKTIPFLNWIFLLADKSYFVIN